jgi:hypothetical protein
MKTMGVIVRRAGFHHLVWGALAVEERMHSPKAQEATGALKQLHRAEPRTIRRITFLLTNHPGRRSTWSMSEQKQVLWPPTQTRALRTPSCSDETLDAVVKGKTRDTTATGFQDDGGARRR